MNRLNVNQARCEALFASGLQRSDTLTASVLTEVISRTVRQLGHRGCISLMAQEFGDHPEAAAQRMRWIRGDWTEWRLASRGLVSHRQIGPRPLPASPLRPGCVPESSHVAQTRAARR